MCVCVCIGIEKVYGPGTYVAQFYQNKSTNQLQKFEQMGW